ncbi:B12-binding domain-containing radical SAM protein [Candidatus Woesearchaeota archaeon]|nr:B12-binding domain-containing radical SAM protein [Candidatus Woesearchaeota archaeon]
MAKVLFIQDVIFEFVGIQTLSAVLKEAGHKTDLLVYSNFRKKRDLLQAVKRISPDIVSFSIPSFAYAWSVDLARRIKKHLGIPSIFGGPHPTYYPEFIKTEGVEIICIGEGEGAIVDVADAIETGKEITHIKNIWVKKDGKIHKNELRPFVDLDSLPDVDRDIHYGRFKWIRDFPNKRVVTTRGCPYNCNFCFNSVYREMYKGKGKYVRRRSPGKIIEELKLVRKKYGFKTVSFSDENFTTDKRWVFELLDLYKKEINAPFMILGRFNELDEELVRKLKQSGCYYISAGIETGNEKLRNEILNKRLTDEQIINGARLLKKYRIGIFAYNMMGLPMETLDNAFETLELNAKIGVDVSIPTILQPIKGTRLFDIIEENDLLMPDADITNLTGHWDGIPLKVKNKKEIQNLQNLFMLGLWFPWTIPLIRKLVRFPPNLFYRVFLKYSILVKYMKTRRLNLYEVIRTAWQVRKNV